MNRCDLDVRSQYELDTDGRIPGAHHIHITQLPQRVTRRREMCRCSSLRQWVALRCRRLPAAGPGIRGPDRAGRAAGWNSTTCPLDLREAAL